MPRFPIHAKTKAQLLDITTPDSASQPECLPWMLYDSQNLATAAGTQSVPFFVTQSADTTISNMESSGQLPDPQFFEIWWIGISVLFTALSTSATIAGNINDLIQILNTGRTTFELNLSNKRYGPWPMEAAHALGGVSGYFTGAPASPGTDSFANNGPQDGGFWVGGQIVIPPKVGFNITLRTGAAITLAQTPVLVRVCMTGALYRRVL